MGAQSYIDPSLLPSGSKVVAADLSHEMLKRLRKADHKRYAGFVTAKATSLPFRNDKFSRELATFMMRYLTDEDQLYAIAELVRTTAPGGQIHLIDFDDALYPKQVNVFKPEMLLESINTPRFTDRVGKLGKKIRVATNTEIPRTIPDRPAHLYHVTLDVGGVGDHI